MAERNKCASMSDYLAMTSDVQASQRASSRSAMQFLVDDALFYATIKSVNRSPVLASHYALASQQFDETPRGRVEIMLPGTIVPNSYLPTRVRKELDWAIPVQLGDRQIKAKRVQEWLTIAGFPVVIDADFGPATEQRVRDFQAARGLGVTGIVDAATHAQLVAPLVNAIAPIAPGGMTLSDLILAYALQHVAQHPIEVGGDNRGPWVRAYMANDGVDWKWCSGFVCFALEQAARTLGVSQPVASSASCDVMRGNAFAAGRYRQGGSIAPATILPGSFFLVRRTNTDWTHIGIVSQAGASTFRTVEGNTNDGGSVNGFEACERVRDYNRKDFIIW